MTDTTTTIAVDPGRTSGVALWRGDRLLAFERVVSGPEEIDPKVGALVELSRRCDVPLRGSSFDRLEADVVFVTEAQFLGKGDPARFRSALSTASNGVAWRVLARIMRARVLEPVHAASWRATFGIASRPDAPDLKRQAIELVARRLDVVVDENVAEAILLGLHSHLKRYDRRPARLAWVAEEKLEAKAASSRARTTRGTRSP